MKQTHDAAIIDEFEKLGRTRALTDEESLQLERAIRSSSRKGRRPWLPRDIITLRKLVRQRKRSVDIAAAMDRTPHAVRQMAVKLRKKGKCGYVSPVGGTGRYPRKGLRAGDGSDGV